jgi:hypothetical protein
MSWWWWWWWCFWSISDAAEFIASCDFVVDYIGLSVAPMSHLTPPSRVKKNDADKAAAKKAGKFVQTKRQPAAPRTGHFVKLTEATEYRPIPYEILA